MFRVLSFFWSAQIHSKVFPNLRRAYLKGEANPFSTFCWSTSQTPSDFIRSPFVFIPLCLIENGKTLFYPLGPSLPLSLLSFPFLQSSPGPANHFPLSFWPANATGPARSARSLPRVFSPRPARAAPRLGPAAPLAQTASPRPQPPRLASLPWPNSPRRRGPAPARLPSAQPRGPGGASAPARNPSALLASPQARRRRLMWRSHAPLPRRPYPRPRIGRRVSQPSHQRHGRQDRLEP